MQDTDCAFERLYRQHYGQLLAFTARLTGDLYQAEDLVQSTYIKAMKQWPNAEYTPHAGAWLLTTTRNAALDYLGSAESRTEKLANEQSLEHLEAAAMIDGDPHQHPALADDMLRLMFTCCHPALSIDARVALCLNTICGLRTEEIARAFITSDATMSQRLWRAKSKIRDAGISYQIPDNDELPARLQSVLASIYLIFNEGWLASSGEQNQRFELINEAIRLARLLVLGLRQTSEVTALLALMLLQHSRRDARFNEQGELVRQAEQDRSLWRGDEIGEATEMLKSVFKTGHGLSRYALMAAIAATHANTPQADATDWNEIVTLYEALMNLDPSPVVALNHAVAIGERDGPDAGLQHTERLSQSALMQRYYLFHSTRAEFLSRLGRNTQAAEAYQQALTLCGSEVEQQFLQRQLDRLQTT
ncbi:MAG: RNA polymerase sigma factor [Pseudomonadales bacterium]